MGSVIDLATGFPLLERIVATVDRETLADLIEAAIKRLDELDGDPDVEPEEDRDDAGEDGVFSGSVIPAKFANPDLSRWDEDAEQKFAAVFVLNQADGDKLEPGV